MIEVQDRNRVEMSQRERDVLKVMQPVLDGQRTQAEAARLLKRSPHQIRRIQRQLEAGEDATANAYSFLLDFQGLQRTALSKGTALSVPNITKSWDFQQSNTRWPGS